MALKKVVNYCNRVAERADRMGKHDISRMILEELESYRWASFDPRIAKAIDHILIFQYNAIFGDILPQIAEQCNLTMDELNNILHIQEYLDYIRRREKRYLEIEREAEIRHKEKQY